MHPLAEKVLARDMRGTARACRWADDRTGDYLTVLKDLFPHTGRAWTIGVTGNPGAGKSTLTDRLIAVFRKQGKRVAVVAIDPTSPFSGGAILGDRIRMQAHFSDPDVFIRSLATRGALGGLSRSAADVIRVLDAWGADVILVETVGVGQDELEITRTADTTLVVMAPGLGDDVQAIKAGLLECADVFAVNKADREGADAAVRDLELMIALGGEVVKAGVHSRGHAAGTLDIQKQVVRHDANKWVPPVARTVSTRDEGVAALVTQLEAHYAWLTGTESGAARRFERLREAMRTQLREALLDAAMGELGSALDDAAQAVAHRQTDPYTAAEQLVTAFRGR
ncbi:methylmalonyl Co-A mutase-associated GTPase MeaB [Polyangium jinanense]|uniref:Methylmalonyl Co-A mutase-associated GTPase MeaB n=1 Tax=Polyangium jinanense TaxID=2829994 RepID=A0A9X3XEG7_9BACT|nr:methylmalonyl Co-A mutase-associated GTPase MeaB [Polyangium jinanense]MDC3957746.1 methylmalonyl Co-A mutase-associated GTPase MeaB [Polyangium jinanense]MDC3987538.1 methylmalonyl Co-A mutase-associated GTPase MeaB [Polyangium jinanense]